MSTHYIEEAQRLTDRVAIMSAGRVVAEGTPAELIRVHAGHEAIEVFGSPAELRALRERANADGVPTRACGPALSYLRAEDLDGAIPSGHRRASTLEDVFVLLTGEHVE
jgi:lipooligosaccharide transport system ATP-binding protein